MEQQGKNVSTQTLVARMVEDIVGCKWSLAVLEAVQNNVIRPGAIQRSIEGISTKVLNERLSKMVRYGILVKEAFPEVPPRVEYRLTPFGEKFVEILDKIYLLQGDLSGGQKARNDGRPTRRSGSRGKPRR